MWPRISVAFFAVLLTSCAATEPIALAEAKQVPFANQLLYHDPNRQGASIVIDGGDVVAQEPRQATADAQTVPVTIVRDQGFFGAGLAATVLVNGRAAAYLGAGEKVTLHIPPGNYVIEAALAGRYRAESILPVQAGRPLYYRIRLVGSSTFIYPWVKYGE